LATCSIGSCSVMWSSTFKVFSLRRQRRCSYRICTRQCCWPRCTFTFIAILNIYSLPELLLLLHPFNGLLQHLFMSTNIHSNIHCSSTQTRQQQSPLIHVQALLDWKWAPKNTLSHMAQGHWSSVTDIATVKQRMTADREKTKSNNSSFSLMITFCWETNYKKINFHTTDNKESLQSKSAFKSFPSMKLNQPWILCYRHTTTCNNIH